MRRETWHILHSSALSLWLGAAALTAFVVAPAAFEALPTRAAAGAYVGGILRPVFVGGILAGGLALLAARRRPGRFPIARSGAAAWVALTGIASLALAARIASMRTALGPIDLLPPDDPARRAFGALHGISVLVFLGGMLAALLAIALESAQETRRSPASP